MDQVKIGQFIANMRKQQQLTQRQLAENIGISAKTVSKWETGKGLPEVSLMLPLCEQLHINVNELLSGERLADNDYQKKAEENMMELIREKQESKQKIILSVIVCILTILSGVTLIMIAGTLEMKTWIRIVLIMIAVIVMFGGISVAVVLDLGAGTFECTKCGKRFVPSTVAYIAGAHTITRRQLKCPYCGKVSYCRKRLTH